VRQFEDPDHHEEIENLRFVDTVGHPYTEVRTDEILGSEYLKETSELEADELDQQGFLTVTADVEAGNYFAIVFQGSSYREYSFGDFEVEAR
ncbi:MAG: hypothetical protein ACOCWU_03895, partial [Spirochaetota bacterium]